MPEFENATQLKEGIAETFPLILENFVEPVATQIYKNRVDSEVYNRYTPVEYNRRYALKEDIYRSIGQKTMHSWEFEITSNASANHIWVFHNGGGKDSIHINRYTNQFPGAFLKMLEGRNFGLWKKGFPRPVISVVQADINSSASIKQAIQTGLKTYIG